MGGGGCCIGDCGFISGIIDGIRDFFCSNSCCVGASSAPSDSERHAKEVADELAENREKNIENAKAQEQKYVEYLGRSMNSFMTELQKMNQEDFGGKTLNINISGIKKKNKKLQDQVVGSIEGVLNQRLVQTDKELSVILENRDREERQKNFQKFIERVQKDALSQLKKNIKKSVDEQSKMVRTEINTRLAEVNESMEESLTALEEIRRLKKEKDGDLELKRSDFIYKGGLCDLLLDEVEAAKVLVQS